MYLGLIGATAIGAGLIACVSTSASTTNDGGAPASNDDGGTTADGSVGNVGTDASNGGGDGASGGTANRGSVGISQGTSSGISNHDVSAAFVRQTLSTAAPATCAGSGPFSSGACTGEVLCTNTGSDAGAPAVTELNAGTITITGASLDAGPTTIAFGVIPGASPPTNGYVPSSSQGLFFAGGDTLQATSAGGPDLPAFNVSVVAPSAVTLSAPVCGNATCADVDRTKDLVVTWTGGGAGKLQAIYETLSDQHAVIVTCTFSAASGTGTVPLAVLAKLEATGDPGITGAGFGYATYIAQNESTFTESDIPSTFEVHTAAASGSVTFK